MAKEPAGRYESASALAEDIRCWMADEPVSAYPEGLGRPGFAVGSQASARRGRASTALLATATVAMAASTWMIASERDKVVTAEIKSRRSFDLLQEFVPELLKEIASPRMSTSPQLLDLRRVLIGKATIFAPKLTEIDQADPRLRRLEAMVVGLSAANERLDDQLGPASRHLDRAVVLLRGLVKDGPDPSNDALDLAEALREKAALDLTLGRFTDVEAAYREAMALGSLTPGVPQQPDSPRVMARLQARLAYVLRETGRPREAIAASDAAIQALSSLSDTNSDDPPNLAAAHLTRARALADLGTRDAVLAEFDESVRIARALRDTAKDDPSDAEFDLACTLLKRAAFLAPDSSPQAIDDAKNAIALIKTARERSGPISYLGREQARAKVILGGILVERKELDEAERLAIEARDEIQALVDKHDKLIAESLVLGQAQALVGRIDRIRGRADGARASLTAALARFDARLKLKGNEKSPDDLAGKSRAQAELESLPRPSGLSGVS